MFNILNIERSKSKKLSPYLIEKLNELKEEGTVVLEEFVKGDELKNIIASYQKRLENYKEFELPCLAQSLIDSNEHREVIENKFKYTPAELEQLNLTFNKEDIKEKEYNEIINTYKPPTLKTYIPDEYVFFNVWLNPFLLSLIESYMGQKPKLHEAYIRRNFFSKYKVMNHYWHRDKNHEKHLLKAFIFLSDCENDNGPHEYIKKTCSSDVFTKKSYYEENEINAVFPDDSARRFKSLVKAGTVILEDTRGLHRANIPTNGVRDLGFAVFFPKSFLHKYKTSHYSISKRTYNKLDSVQKKYIPREFLNSL